MSFWIGEGDEKRLFGMGGYEKRLFGRGMGGWVNVFLDIGGLMK